jgi:hypothetical protein
LFDVAGIAPSIFVASAMIVGVTRLGVHAPSSRLSLTSPRYLTTEPRVTSLRSPALRVG